jgi:hypothetical protein
MAMWGEDVDNAIGGAAQRYGLAPALMRTFAKIESSGRPNARTGSYKGLFQLSDSEFAKHGGGSNIFDPVANANAAGAKLAAESAAFKAKYGRDPSAHDLYMIHQQGEGGYAAHTGNPTAPAWQNMYSTAEGRQKGPGWAKQAIWGNVPADVRARYPGGVDSLTSQQFLDLWKTKVDGIGGNMNRNSYLAEQLLDPTSPHYRMPAMGGTTTAGAPSGGPMPVALPSAPTGRHNKLADALLAAAAGAKPKGWGDLINAAGDLALGYTMSNKQDAEEKAYRSKLSEALMGAKDNDALVNTMLSSGDPDLQSAAVNLKVAQMKPKAAEVGRFKVENGAVIDTATGQIVAGELQQKGDGIQRVSPGETLFDPRTGKPIYTADQKPQGPQTVSPGQVIVDPATGREIYSAPEKEQGPVTVSPGQRLVDPKTGIDLYAAPDKAEGLQTVAPGATLYDPNTKQPVFTATPKAGDFKEGQTKAANFGKMMTEAEKLVGDQPNPLGFWEQLREGVSPEVIANQMRSPEYQKYRQAADQWIRAKLRKESGATITPEESEGEFRTFFPQPGDSPDVVAQKKAARQQAIQGMVAESGGAYDSLFSGQPTPAPVTPPPAGQQGAATPPSAPKLAARPQDVTDEQIMQEANKAMREGKDPAAVRQQLEAWGIRF